ncbi:MAG: nucleoside triphosphate pyrophosphohydrolase [Balneolaceae bacterium]|nr:nucleoside triphosphate pyrophosphohydrolase [Balneolaceae bacterium]MDR9446106.1 nucleoside triphosphate pyrophosphohydrolase [Balneolaceae bacterium]
MSTLQHSLVLISASPRRKELLESIGFSPRISPSGIDERVDPSLSPKDLVLSLAKQKVDAVCHSHPQSLCIGADTVVVHRSNILGKPSSDDEALNMLQQLSGETHEVWTGVYILRTDNQGQAMAHETFAMASRVTFHTLDASLIEEYIATGSPRDKAGAYGIQDPLGALMVERIDGDYTNIIGLPLHPVYQALHRLDQTPVNPPTQWAHIRPRDTFTDLETLVSVLRIECPWDREQTHESVKNNLVEETYEVVEAIEQAKPEELKKELGDLLLHVLFHARIAQDQDHFSVRDVIQALSEKLIRRHPHVFGDTVASHAGAVAKTWEETKLAEGRESILDGIPMSMPSAIVAHRIQQKVSSVGFDWQEWDIAWEKVEEELQEWTQTMRENDTPARQQDELGDVLFSLINVARLKGLDSESALREANKKFKRRFQGVERQIKAEGKVLSECTLEELENAWQQVKQDERAGRTH